MELRTASHSRAAHRSVHHNDRTVIARPSFRNSHHHACGCPGAAGPPLPADAVWYQHSYRREGKEHTGPRQTCSFLINENTKLKITSSVLVLFPKVTAPTPSSYTYTVLQPDKNATRERRGLLVLGQQVNTKSQPSSSVTETKLQFLRAHTVQTKTIRGSPHFSPYLV